MTPRDARVGALQGLLAAALFGVSPAVCKRLLAHAPPQVLAGLLYLGAGVALTAARALRGRTDEAPLRRADLPTLALVSLAGGVLGPLLMLHGLRASSALGASLMLNLEAPFTITLAALVFREHLGPRALLASALIVAGAAFLRVEGGAQGGTAWGALLLAGACAAWAVDNNLTQRLTVRDPLALVQWKTLAAGAANLSLGLSRGERLPPWRALLVALSLGAVSYGLSVVLDAHALRRIGAAREAAFFATAPFLGALAAVLLGEPPRGVHALAGGLMVAGVALLLRERHGHAHTHEPVTHEHVHAHDEHHQHTHGPDDPAGSPHAHAHTHDALTHDHPHVPDLHHRHRH